MAKILYENKFILTKKLHRQYCEETFKTMRKQIRVLSFVLAAILCVAAIVLLIFFSMKKTALVVGIFGLYFIFMGFFGYTFSEWINFRKLQDEHGETVVMILQFEPKQVHVQVNKTSFRFKYSSISKGYETEDTLILILSRKGMIEHGQVIFKRGFSDKNALSDFKDFINEKTGKTIFSNSTEEEDIDTEKSS